jgi:hypothetical protein
MSTFLEVIVEIVAIVTLLATGLGILQLAKFYAEEKKNPFAILIYSYGVYIACGFALLSLPTLIVGGLSVLSGDTKGRVAFIYGLLIVGGLILYIVALRLGVVFKERKYKIRAKK